MRRAVHVYFPFCGLPGLLLHIHICSPDLRDLQGCLLIHKPKLSRYRPIFWNGDFLLSIAWTLQFDCNVQFDVFLDTHLMSVFPTHLRRSLGFFLRTEKPEAKMLCKCLLYVFHTILSRPFLEGDRCFHIFYIFGMVTISYSYSTVFPLMLQFFPEWVPFLQHTSKIIVLLSQRMGWKHFGAACSGFLKMPSSDL